MLSQLGRAWSTDVRVWRWAVGAKLEQSNPCLFPRAGNVGSVLIILAPLSQELTTLVPLRLPNPRNSCSLFVMLAPPSQGVTKYRRVTWPSKLLSVCSNPRSKNGALLLRTIVASLSLPNPRIAHSVLVMLALPSQGVTILASLGLWNTPSVLIVLAPPLQEITIVASLGLLNSKKYSQSVGHMSPSAVAVCQSR